MANKVLCGVPREFCTGGSLKAIPGLKEIKGHSDSEDAFRCYRRYLILQGYEQIGPREFRDPHNGTIRVLTKRSHFGARMRTGKEHRWMPDDRNAGAVISS